MGMVVVMMMIFLFNFSTLNINSGPKRYRYDNAAKQWVDNRDATVMLNTLQEELKKLCKVDILS
jgi:frataxin-like iron-binding protein CyaY